MSRGRIQDSIPRGRRFEFCHGRDSLATSIFMNFTSLLVHEAVVEHDESIWGKTIVSQSMHNKSELTNLSLKVFHFREHRPSIFRISTISGLSIGKKYVSSQRKSIKICYAINNHCLHVVEKKTRLRCVYWSYAWEILLVLSGTINIDCAWNDTLYIVDCRATSNILKTFVYFKHFLLKLEEEFLPLQCQI